MRNRATYVPCPQLFNLNAACTVICNAFGWGSCFLVGSSLQKRDYRDVDVRCILDDGDYAKLFPSGAGTPHMDPMWSLLCSSISSWLQKQTGLPIDFQIQQMTKANAENNGPRYPLGIFIRPNPADYGDTAAQELTSAPPGK